MLFLAPVSLARSSPLAAAAAFVYQAAGLVCHQRPERSFHLVGIQQPVCARCLGLYVSGAAAAAAGWVGSRGRRRGVRHARVAFVIAALPTAVTVAAELAGLAHPSNTVRALSALPLGAVAGWVFVRSLLSETAVSPARAGGGR